MKWVLLAFVLVFPVDVFCAIQHHRRPAAAPVVFLPPAVPHQYAKECALPKGSGRGWDMNTLEQQIRRSQCWQHV